jgi:mannose-1-phosphate guanylyltransferase
VENPSAYGLVETDDQGNIKRFLEKPKPDEITCNTINAGIYILEPDTFDRIPKDTPWSIERSFFPSLIERGETFVAYVYRGYWIDIGTPEKYMQVHRDIMDGRCTAYKAPKSNGGPSNAWINHRARIEEGATVEGPCFVDEGTVVKSGARIGPYSVVGRQCHIEEHAVVERSILWANSRISQEATVRRSILGRHCHIGRNATVEDGVVLGDKSVVTDHSRL